MNKNFTIPALAAIVMTPVVSLADTQTYTSNATLAFGGAGTYSTSQFTPNLPKFDPNDGTLLAVRIWFDTRLSGKFQGTWGNPAGNRNITLSSFDRLTFAGQTISFNGSETRNVSLSKGTYSFSFSYGGGLSASPSDISSFVGPGSLGSASWSSSINIAGTNEFSNSSLFGSETGTIGLEYQYEPTPPVPEPAGLIALGLGVVAFFRNRKN